jgi:hypothetical protein
MEFAGSSVWNRQSFVLDTSSADLKGTSPLSASIAPSLANSQSAWRSSASTSVVFIDATVKDYQQLVAGVQAGAEVHVLNPAQDAIAQITQTLLGRSGISSVHLVSHGEAGEVQLGNTLLTGSTLGSYAAQFKSWSQALTDDADILLYGCDVAQGDQGRAFIQQFSQLTGADIAASNNLTGSSDAGGDWTLEVNTGKIAASIAFQSDTLAAYHGILPVDLISAADPTLFSDSVGGYNGAASTSLDGRYVVFTSSATNLVNNDTNGASDVFLFDRSENTVKLISHQSGSNSALSATGISSNAIISSNGNYVAFTSTASDLVSTDIQNTTGRRNIFVWDRQNDSTTLVSRSTVGLSGNNNSSGYSISATGDAIAFVSQATNLNSLDSNTKPDVYLWTKSDNKVALVSRNAAKTGSSDLGAGSAVLSSDGNYVAFTSNSTNLIANDPDTNQLADVFLWQRSTDPATDNSVLIAVTTGGNVSGTPSISIGGTSGDRVAFVSNNALTGANDTNNLQDVFVWTRSTIDPTKGTIQLVSANSLGNSGTTPNSGIGDGSFRPVISESGNYVAFTSTASDLVADDTNGKKDVFLRDLTAGTTILVNRDSAGVVGNDTSDYASLSQNGKRVSFISSATNLVSNDTNGTQDVFVRDITTNSTFLISHTPSGIPGNNRSGSSSITGSAVDIAPVISGDGNFVAFNSAASDLVANDADGAEDVFITGVGFGNAVLATRRNTGSATSKTGSGDSNTSPGASVSADGRYVVFTSKAPELVANDANGAQDVFLRDLQTGQTTLISRNTAGTGSAAGDSINPQISADGRYIVFSSTASDIVANDGNTTSDIFWYDRQTNKMVLVSHANGDTATANGASLNPVLSADGLYVAFVSSAANLTGDTTNSKQNIFIWDSNTNTTTLASHIGSSGGNGDSDSPVISSDGQYVAFASVASDLIGGDSNGRKDVFVWNRANNTVTLVSQNSAGTIGDSDSFAPSISSNGRVIAFASSAANLGGGTDANSGQDIFVRNLDANTTTLVSVNTSNTYSAGGGTAFDRFGAFNPVISGNGGFVAFSSTFTDLSSNDNNAAEDVFVRDLTNNTTQLVSINSLGNSGTGTSNGASGTGTGSSNPVISSDGRFVGFSSYSNDLVSGDTNGVQDIFVRDLSTSSTTWMSRDLTDTTGGNAASFSPIISSTGNYLAFTSNASNLTDADFNSKSDVFGAAITTIVSLTAANKQVAESGGATNPTYEIRRSRTSGALTIKLKIDATSTATIAASVGAIADFTPTLDAGSFTISGSDLIITMPDGVGVVTLTLTPQNDIQAEADEFVKLALLNDLAYSIATGANADSVTILANDTVVTTTSDSGEGSLRQAILNANAFAGQDTISFNILGEGVETISLASALPDVTDSAIIDGTTQPGYTTTPIIELDGSGAGNANGLRITAGNSTVKGLIINRFSQNGIRLETNGNNIIQGNYIGTDSDGGSTVGNRLDGISIASDNNTIGGTTPEAGNIIANNQGAGVTIEGNVAGNRIQENAIFSNAGLGIDLGKDGVTPNDAGDGDVGANGLQNTAVLTIAEPVGTNTFISGTFDGVASSTFRVEFFSSTTADPSGFGEGETFLGTTDIITDATGKASINYTYAGTVAAGQVITATITDSNGNTSEFSNTHVVGAPKVTISPTTLSHQEGTQGNTTEYAFTIGLDQASSQEVQVQVSTSDATASSASDYTSLNQTVTFAPGETVKTVTVNVIGDNVKEPDETFNVSLSNVVNAELGTDATAIATILDDDNPPTISIANITPATITEGDSGTTAYSFEVKLSNATSDPVTVSYATADGSATTSDNDYTAISATTLTFAPGETSKTITVLGTGDVKFEQDEDFTVALSNPSSNASIATATASGLIKNDDQGSTINISAVSQVNEGAEGTTTDYVFTVTLDKPSGEVVTVKYATEDGSATTIDNDYVATTNTLTFAPNTTTQTFTVKVNGDRKFEDDEQFKVILSEPTNGSVSVAQGGAIATIKNDDVAPIVTITAPASLPEGNTGVSQANFVVSLADPSGKPVTVNYSTVDGTALAGEDYTAQLNQTLTFAPGETQKTIAIDVLGDTKRENDETFSVKLTSATDATLSDPNGVSATVTIQNDDQPPAISILNTTQNKLEGDSGTTNPNTFDITLSNASDQVITVQYDALDGNLAQGANATLADNDFEATSSTVTFNPGETKKTVTVNVKGDSNKEQDESYLVKLSNSTNATIASDTAIGVIQNDDSSPAISITNGSIDEGNLGQTALKFTVNLSSASIDPITVNYSTSDGTATLGDNDYASVSNATLTFAPGETSKDITIFVNGDTKLESDEGFTVTLSNPTNATIASDTAIGTIKNDDTQPTVSLVAPAKVEGNTTNPFSFVVSLSNASDKAVTVNYSTEDGTALAGEDYTAQLNQTLTFAPGETQKTIAIDVLGDTKRENDETFSVKLTSATDATLPDPNGISATATIQNDDQPPAISIVNTTQNKLEGDSGTTNPNTFDIILSNPSDQIVTVQYDALDGNLAQGANATLADNDFEATSNTVTFNAGETKKTVTVNVKGDSNKEQDESYLVKLSNSTNATIASDTAIGVIQNDDNNPAISISDASVVEGNLGQTALKFTVNLSSTSTDPITVTYSTSDGTATLSDNDYTNVSNATLTFAPGETSKDITIFVNGDTKLESDEGFNVTLSNPTNATIASDTAIGTIKNDDTQPTLSLTAPAKVEGNTTNPFSFVVSLSNASDKAVTVNYSTEDGTALAGEDYTAQLNQTLTFAPGETQKTIAIDVLGDTKRENDETFSVKLTSATDATLPDPNGISATATIQNDDQPPAISIVNTTQNQLEGASGAITPNTFDITLSNASDQVITVQYDAFDGNLAQGANATLADNDFEATSNIVTFNPGETKKTVTVNVKGDSNKEQDESYLVKLSNVSNTATIASDTAIGVISNDDGAPAIIITDASVVEGDSGQTALKFTVTLSGTSIDPITVNYSTSDGTATLVDNDYVGVSNATLTFAPGETSKDVTVFVNGDTKLESDEGFNLTLSNPTNATIATTTAIGTIKNDDRRPTLGISGVSKGEGNSGTQNYVFTVTLSNASADVITVDYQTQDDTATIADGDYLQQVGKLTFNPGDPLQQQITVQVQGDNKFEPTEKFTVNLLDQSVVNADIAVKQADGVIINDDSQPTLSLSGRQSHTEGNSGTTPFVFDVNLSNPSSDVITVKYDTIPGTATSDVDYISASGTLTFNPGEQKKTITILGNGDTNVEADEDFILRLSAPTNAILPSNATDAQGVIQNDDQPPFPTISIDDATTSEGNTGTTTALKFKVKLSQATTIPVTVQYATSDGTATTTDSDYIGIPATTLTFAPGETEKEVAVTVNGDNKFEASEIFNVTLSNPTNAGLSTIAQQAKGTISNDDAKPTLSINTVADSEGDTGLKDFIFTVALSNPTADTVQVNYDTIDGTALVSDNDYQRATGTLTFAPGTPLTQSVAVKVVGDRKFEPNETFTVSLKNPQNADLSTVPNQGVGTITADDFRPTLNIQNDQQLEGNSGTTPLTFTVGLSNPSSETITVQYTTKPGTADTTDYTPSTGTLTFAPNEVTKTITVQALGDTQYELDETFTVELSNPDKALLPSSGTTLSATGTIKNDDPLPQLQATAPADQLEGNSGITPFVFEVTLSQASPVPVTVSYTTADGKATIADNDYTQATGTLTFNPREVKKTVTVNVLGDTRPELNETFQFKLSSPTNATIAADSTMIYGTIDNDDLNPNNQVNQDSKTDIVWRNARTGEDSIWYLSNSTYNKTLSLPTMTEAGWRVRATADFNKDGNDDILWQNDLTSAVKIWMVENNQVVKDVTLSIVPGLNWKIMGAADFNLDHKADIIWRNTQTGENAVWLMDGTTLTRSSYFLSVLDQSWKMQQFGDFDNDGDTDILWRNISTGEVYFWQMQNMQFQASFALPKVADLAWQIEGVSDFTGDGVLDILWRNSDTYTNVIWQIHDLAFERSYEVKPVTERGWDIERLGDFNGDRNTDILWHNDLTGQNAIWYMNKTNLGAGIYLPLLSDAGWNSSFVGDFDNNHTLDILYHNDLTQESMIWELNPTLFVHSTSFTTVSDTNWVIDLSGDFNGDGEADLLWRNVRTGEAGIWLMKNGERYANGFGIQFGDPAWTAEAAADFDGDGNLDLLWRNHRTGEVAVWKMNGAFRADGNYLMQIPDLDWEIAGVKDFNRDLKPDILWHNRRTGETGIWLMNGFQYTSSVLLPTVDNHWLIKGIGDFNIDNQPDLLWLNQQTGETAIWLMNDTQLSLGKYLPTAPNTDWDIYAVRDFGADGLTDILWRNNQTGNNMIWFLNQTDFGLDSYLPSYVDTDWRIEAVDDFKDKA